MKKVTEGYYELKPPPKKQTTSQKTTQTFISPLELWKGEFNTASNYHMALIQHKNQNRPAKCKSLKSMQIFIVTI